MTEDKGRANNDMVLNCRGEGHSPFRKITTENNGNNQGVMNHAPTVDEMGNENSLNKNVGAIHELPLRDKTSCKQKQDDPRTIKQGTARRAPTHMRTKYGRPGFPLSRE